VLVLITGATGKVGRHLIARLLSDPARADVRIRALCHNRTLPADARIEMVRGSLDDRAVAEAAVAGVSHVVHLATCKETPDSVMDVTVKGLFWLLEAFRSSRTAQRFVLVGGDAAIGHFYWRSEAPLTEATPHRAYPGCYALSKVLEEVMLQQVCQQYDLDGCCIRAPWIMAEDDFRYSLSFGDDLFGGPDWKTMVAEEAVEGYRRTRTVPLLKDADDKPLKRNFVHVDDLTSALSIALDHPDARQQLFNVGMDEPVDYGVVADYLKRTRGLPSVAIPSSYHSTWLDNSKAKFRLGWRPKYDTEALIEAAWRFERSADNPRRVWYPG
jgi:UDP-glucose 4-epimerase